MNVLQFDNFSRQDVSGWKSLGIIVAGTALYGFAFGLWRSPLQAAYSAIKMPLLFLSTIAASGTANAMLSQVLGAGLSFRQVLSSIASGMAIRTNPPNGLQPSI
jgi:hypothetical protein